jgi:hypothetical protein
MPKLPKKPPRKSLSGRQAWDEIKNTVRNVENRHALTKFNLIHTADVVVLFNNMQESPKRQTYRAFLNELLHECGLHGVLSCAIALGQTKVVNMNKGERRWFMESFKTNRNRPPISSPILQSLALDSEFVAPSLSYADKVGLKDILPKEEQQGQNGGRCSIALEQQQDQASVHGLTEPEEVFENASLHGIAEVFNAHVCTSIRQIATQGGTKASVQAHGVFQSVKALTAGSIRTGSCL